MRYFKNKYKKNGRSQSFYRVSDEGAVEYYINKSGQVPYWTRSRKFSGRDLTKIIRFREVTEGYVMLNVM